MIVKMKLAMSALCRPCLKQDREIERILKAQEQIKREFKVDRILKKIKVLEGIVQENVLHQSKLKWAQAYDKYSLFKVTDEPSESDEAVEKEGTAGRVTFQNFEQINFDPTEGEEMQEMADADPKNVPRSRKSNVARQSAS